MPKTKKATEDVRQLPTVQIRFSPICLDPTQIGVLTAGQAEPETLDAYIRRLIREECASGTGEGEESIDPALGFSKGEANFRRLFPLADQGGDEDAPT